MILSCFIHGQGFILDFLSNSNACSFLRKKRDRSFDENFFEIIGIVLLFELKRDK